MRPSARPGPRGSAVLAGALALALGACGTTPTTPVVSPTATATATAGSPPTTTQPSPTTGASPSHTPAALEPPFVASARWVSASGGRSLHVVPTPAGRTTQGAGDADEAWSEVLRLAPEAAGPGMRAQFDCHWQFARVVAPDKSSWNLEPWRPVVSWQQMMDARCNPGGPESADT